MSTDNWRPPPMPPCQVCHRAASRQSILGVFCPDHDNWNNHEKAPPAPETPDGHP